MLARVDTLQRTSGQQTNYFQIFEARLQRLEEMHASTLEKLAILTDHLQSNRDQEIKSNESRVIQTSESKQDLNDSLRFTAVSTPEDLVIPSSGLLAANSSRPVRSSSFNSRKSVSARQIPSSAPPQIIIGPFQELLTMKTPVPSSLTVNEERLPLGANTLSVSTTSINLCDEANNAGLHEAEETEHNIYGKLIKERLRKLSEVVEDIERTLPSHQERRDSKHEKRDIMNDDDETLSTMDWVDTTGRTAYNSTRVSRLDVNQDENDHAFTGTNIQITEETFIPNITVHRTSDDENKST